MASGGVYPFSQAIQVGALDEEVAVSKDTVVGHLQTQIPSLAYFNCKQKRDMG